MTQLKNTTSHDELLTALHHHVVNVSFRKADGAVRHMKATLQESHLPEFTTVHTTPNTTDQNLFKVWDMEKQAWRSFRADRLDAWQIEP